MKRRNLQSFQNDILQRQREFEQRVKIRLFSANGFQLESLYTMQFSVVVICAFFLVFTGDRDAEFGEAC